MKAHAWNPQHETDGPEVSVCRECHAVDPEYFDGEHCGNCTDIGVQCDECGTWTEDGGWCRVCHERCGLCDRKLLGTEHNPICASCDQTARAHARQIQAAKEYAEDCRNDPFLDPRVNR